MSLDSLEEKGVYTFKTSGALYQIEGDKAKQSTFLEGVLSCPDVEEGKPIPLEVGDPYAWDILFKYLAVDENKYPLPQPIPIENGVPVPTAKLLGEQDAKLLAYFIPGDMQLRFCRAIKFTDFATAYGTDCLAKKIFMIIASSIHQSDVRAVRRYFEESQKFDPQKDYTEYVAAAEAAEAGEAAAAIEP
jgi:hypothetical protein